MNLQQISKKITVFTLGINAFAALLLASSATASTNSNGYLSKNSLVSNNNVSIISDLDLDQIETSEKNHNLLEERAVVQVAQRAGWGKASWYGPKFHGRRTANGEIFNSNALTAAHRSLPFGTKVKVTNVRNGRSVIVRINDRGPFIKGRIIDVSAGAARRLNMIGSGIATVQLEILGR